MSSRRFHRTLAAALLGCAGPALAQTGAAGGLPVEQMRQLAAVYGNLKDSFVEPLTGEALLVAAIRGMVQGVDPEGGEYYTPDELKAWRGSGTAGASALGLQLQFRARAVLVGSVTTGGPAERAGVKPGELIEAVDGTATPDLRSFQISRLLDGPEGSAVVLDIAERGGGAPRRVELRRGAPLRIDLALSRPAPGTAVLRAPQFQERTLEQVGTELAREWARERFDSLVLDLRGNPGGLLDVSIGMAAMFLPPDAPVLKTVGRIPESNQAYRARPTDYARRGDPLATLPAPLRALPMVVLVDESTSAGAEIVAAALKDHGRAAIVGRPTFGRGSIQTVRMLPDGGAVKFTTAVWESPSGTRLNGRGVQPDVPVARGSSTQQELDAAVAEARRRATR